MKPLFPYFGGKSAIAHEIWAALGDTPNYVEPFCGSAAVLFARPESATKQVETINDFDGFVANFWRAVSQDPEAVAKWADWPVNECDLSARHAWLVNRAERVRWQLEDPDWYDAKVAGWWVWGACAWIGAGWCAGKGPHVGNGARIVDTRQLPHLSGERGINRQLPHLGNAGQGIASPSSPVLDMILEAHARLRRVRVACGDWKRVLGPSVTEKIGVTGIFLDPPYAGEKGGSELYSHGTQTVFGEVAAWCRDNGDNPKLRIVLAGHEGDADLPGWRTIAWKRHKGYGKTAAAKEMAAKEVLWLSPHCVYPEKECAALPLQTANC